MSANMCGHIHDTTHTVTHTTACVQLTVTMLKWLGNVFVGYWLRKYSALTPVDARERRK